MEWSAHPPLVGVGVCHPFHSCLPSKPQNGFPCATFFAILVNVMFGSKENIKERETIVGKIIFHHLKSVPMCCKVY